MAALTHVDMDIAFQCKSVLLTALSGYRVRLVSKAAGGMYPFTGWIEMPGDSLGIFWQFAADGRSSDTLDRAFDLKAPA